MKLFIALTSEISVKTFYLDYLKFLCNKGINVTVASNFQDEATISLVRATGAEVSQIPFTRNPNVKADIAALIAVYKSIKHIKPDTVVYATPKASLLTSIASYVARVPKRIYQLWGLRLETGQGVMKFVLITSEKLIFQLSSKVISVSPSLSSRAVELKLGKKPIVIGYGSSHGVNVDKFFPDKTQFELPVEYLQFLHKNPDAHFVTLIARLSRDKGVDTFIEAMKSLRVTSPNIIGVLVGNLEDESIREMIDQSILEGNVIHIPHTDDIRPFLVHATVNCLPSLREGLPNVVLEASAMGIPSVVTTATGCVDAIVDQETGIMVPTSEQKVLSKAIETIISDDLLREKMSKSGLKLVQARFHDVTVYQQNYEYLLK